MTQIRKTKFYQKNFEHSSLVTQFFAHAEGTRHAGSGGRWGAQVPVDGGSVAA